MTKHQATISILSYNILADVLIYLKNDIEEEIKLISNRAPKIIKQIADLNADIICL